MEHLISLKYDHDTIDVTVWRDRQQIELKGIEMRAPSGLKRHSHLVPIHQYDKESSYYIFGGCAFTVLTQPFLHSWGDDWFHYAPRDLIGEAMKGHLPAPPTESQQSEGQSEGHGLEELVVMSSVRPHHVNMGQSRFCNIILDKVGETKIRSLRHLKEVIECEFIQKMEDRPLIDFHFRKNALMVMDVKSSMLAEAEIMERNRIPNRQSADLDIYDRNDVQEIFDRFAKQRDDELRFVMEQERVERHEMEAMNEMTVPADEAVATPPEVYEGEDHSQLLADCYKEQFPKT